MQSLGDGQTFIDLFPNLITNTKCSKCINHFQPVTNGSNGDKWLKEEVLFSWKTTHLGTCPVADWEWKVTCPVEKSTGPGQLDWLEPCIGHLCYPLKPIIVFSWEHVNHTWHDSLHHEVMLVKARKYDYWTTPCFGKSFVWIFLQYTVT